MNQEYDCHRLRRTRYHTPDTPFDLPMERTEETGWNRPAMTNPSEGAIPAGSRARNQNASSLDALG